MHYFQDVSETLCTNIYDRIITIIVTGSEKTCQIATLIIMY